MIIRSMDEDTKGGSPMKRLLALLIALMLPFAALAESDSNVLLTLLPVMDLAAQAASLTGESIAPETPPTGAFAFHVQRLSEARGLTQEASAIANLPEAAKADHPADEAYMGIRPMFMTESDDGSALRFVGDLYQAEGQLYALDSEQYDRVTWLDRRAMAEFRRSETSPLGWELTMFSLDAEWAMEEAVAEYFTNAMAEYINPGLGFSIQYPALFGENTVTVDEKGVYGKREDASFSVTCVPNAEAVDLQGFLDGKKQEIPGAETNINDITGCGRLNAQLGEEYVMLAVYVTEGNIYQAELRYNQKLNKELSIYADYMMNSFSVDELGLG